MILVIPLVSLQTQKRLLINARHIDMSYRPVHLSCCMVYNKQHQQRQRGQRQQQQ